MKILLTAGSGEGNTTLSAFDKALYDAGVANYNLIPLSSVIPPKTSIIEKKPLYNDKKEWGHRLYVVMSRQSALIKGEEAWAGVGWVQAKDGRGLFVEHHGLSEEQVVSDIKASLTDMQKYRPEKFGEIQWKVKGIRCEDKPVASVVIAIYKAQNWR